jgi:hypothetical protein
MLIAIILFQNCSGSSSDSANPQATPATAMSFLDQYSKMSVTDVLPNYHKGNSKIVDIDPAGNGFLVNTSMIETEKFIEVIAKPSLTYRNIPGFGLPIEKVQYNYDGSKIMLIQPIGLIKRILILNSTDLSIYATVDNVISLEFASKIKNSFVYMYGKSLSNHYYSPETYKYKVYDIVTNESSELYITNPGCWNCAPPVVDSFYIGTDFVYYSIKQNIYKLDYKSGYNATIAYSNNIIYPNTTSNLNMNIKFITSDNDRIYFNSGYQFKDKFYYEHERTEYTEYVYSLNLSTNQIGSFKAIDSTIDSSSLTLIKNSNNGFIYYDSLKKTISRLSNDNKDTVLFSLSSEKTYYSNEAAFFSENENLVLHENLNFAESKDRYLKIYVKNN